MNFKLIFKNKKRMLVALGCLLNFTLFAQEKISGNVINFNNEPLAGATIKIKATNINVGASADGSFSINAKATDVLIFSFVGYQTLELNVGSKKSITAQLMPIDNSLNSVVVIGYSTQRKKDLTGAVSVVNVSEINKIPTGSLTNQLQGFAPGVSIIGSGQPGQEPSVAIRGLNTFGNNTPLYIIDGVPTQNLSSINPNDIASLQVLKDAGAASIYGSRASNGVLIITTKKGSGKVKVQYDAFYGNKKPASGNVWDLLSPQDMANLEWKASKNSGLIPGSALYGNGTSPELPDYIMPVGVKEGDPSTNPSLYNVIPEYTTQAQLAGFYRIVRANKEGTDWFHEIFKPSSIQSHNISVSGGSNQGNYLLSLNYLHDEGNLIYTYLKRFTLRSNAQFRVSDRILIGENLAYSVSDNPTVDFGEGTSINQALREQRIIPVYDIMGNFGGGFTSGGQLLGNSQNPVAQRFRSRNNQGQTNRLLGNVYAELGIIKNLILRSSFGGEILSANFRNFSYPTYENAENTPINTYGESAAKSINWTWTNTLNYKYSYKNIHHINLLGGTESFKNKLNSLSGSNTDYFSFNPDFTTLSSGAGTPLSASSRSLDALVSYFGRFDYSFKGKYLFAATVRRDGSSKFLNYRWGTFPSFSAGWRITEEAFMKNLSWISDLKLRGSWGITGNQINVNAANSFTTFGGDRGNSYYDIAGTNNSIQQGFSQTSIGNPDAKWEKNTNYNIGFDATFLKGQLQVSADYYSKNINDLLFNPILPGAAGQAIPPFINIASIKNTGIDASVTGNFNLTKDLKFTSMLTVTTYKNTIVKVADGIDYFSLDPRRFGIDIIRNQVGSPVSSFYGYKINGFWNEQKEIDAANATARAATGNPAAVFQQDVRVGHFKYDDSNGDGIINSDDRTVLGNPNPDFSYGLNLGLTYKNFDFSIFLYGVQGNEIWNQTKWWTDFYPTLGPGAKSNNALYNSWSPDNKNAKVAIQEKTAAFGTSGVPNSYYVENGSYLRAKNIQLGYTFSGLKFKSVSIQKLRAYMQIANLFTITKYSGVDPELAGSSVNFGIDGGSYGQPRQLLFGLSLNF